jgi:hypothetical protein
MTMSVDGRIVVDRWPVTAEIRKQYEQVHSSYEADGWLCGRVTMEPFAGGTRSENEVAREYEGSDLRQDFIAPGAHESFAFAIDPKGRLAWRSNGIDGDHVVAILSPRVSDDYLTVLRERGVSYLLAGVREIDLPLALAKIVERFATRVLMLEGGGRINGAMLQEGLIDEVSLLVAPVADGSTETPSVFDVDAEKVIAHRLALVAVEQREGDILWLRYLVKRTDES